MHDYITEAKNWVKAHPYLYDWLLSYSQTYKYGYIYREQDVKRFLKKIGKSKHLPYNMKREDLFIFIGDRNPDSTMRKAVFGDIDAERVKQHKCVFYTTHVLKESKWQRVHDLYFKINKFFPLPGKKNWEKKYTTDVIKNDGYNYFFVFLAGPLYAETFSQAVLLKKINTISKETFCRKILYLADPVEKFPEMKRWFPYFDSVISCAIEDQQKYDVEYIDTPCVFISGLNVPIKEDIYFRGMDLGRAELVHACFQYLSENGVSCNFHVQTKRTDLPSVKGVTFSNERISYEEMVLEELSSNVMLEIVIPGIGSGTTLRYKEAVMYGRKLLTNNPTVKELPCFDEKYIHYFEVPEDIDIEWVKSRDLVRYNYHGEFSTDHFCEEISKRR